MASTNAALAAMRESFGRAQAIAATPSDHDEDRVRALVGRLRERGQGGVHAVLRELINQRNNDLGTELSQAGAAALARHDELFMEVLARRYDALDRAAAETSFAIAEIDGEGLISYANAAMERIVPDALGQAFADLFGPRADDVRDALAKGNRETLRLDLQHEGDLPAEHFRGEVGPLRDEHHRLGAYALLLDIEGEKTRLNMAPDAILRLAPDGTIVFANQKATKLLGCTEKALERCRPEALFTGGADISAWLTLEKGQQVELDLLRPDDTTLPVRVSIVPSYDTPGRHAGVFIGLHPIAEERVRAELQRLLAVPDCAPEHLVTGVLKAIGQLLPYDMATFGIYTDDMRYFQTLVVHPQPKEWEWTTAWFGPFDPEPIVELLSSSKSWGPDMGPAVRALAPGIEADPVVRNLVDHEAVKGFVTLPVRDGGGRFRATLTLLSKQEGRYGADDLDRLRELNIEDALHVAVNSDVRRRAARLRALKAALTQASDHRALALCLAEGIGACFGWDYVAVFAVERSTEPGREPGLFRLLSQHNQTGHPALAEGFTQLLTAGLMGSALREDAMLHEPALDKGSRYGFIPSTPDRRSALATPIRVAKQRGERSADQVEWVLAIESRQGNAFQGPDMVSLRDALMQCEAALSDRWQQAVRAALLDAAEQAVIVVDRAGQVRLANGRAERLLGRERGGVLGTELSTLAKDEDGRRVLRSAEPVVQKHLFLQPRGGTRVAVLATQSPMHDDYGHRLWLLTDLGEVEWQGDWKYLEQTAKEVAQSTRLPLLLAGNLVRGVASRLKKEPAIASLLDTAARHLGKADITYERLATTLAARQGPDQPRRVFDAVELLRRTVSELPVEDLRDCDRRSLRRIECMPPFSISGWPEQLGFAYRSLLDHLLLHRSQRGKVEIAFEHAAEGDLLIRLSALTGRPAALPVDGGDRIAMAEARARQAATLAPEAVEAAIVRHGGGFESERNDETLRFVLRLPAPATAIQGAC